MFPQCGGVAFICQEEGECCPPGPATYDTNRYHCSISAFYCVDVGSFMWSYYEGLCRTVCSVWYQILNERYQVQKHVLTHSHSANLLKVPDVAYRHKPSRS